MQLLIAKPEGIYCPFGDFFIDPSRKVKVALITHAHTDHARKGSEHYLCTKETKSLLRTRIKDAKITAIPYNKKIKIKDVEVSFHPAGHILGSAQIRVEHQGIVWVVSGDYKRALDPSCKPFEPIVCDTFITETTFAHPRYTWKKTEEIISEILNWHVSNKKNKIASVLIGYKLGKTQRLIAELSNYAQIYYDSELEEILNLYKKSNVSFNHAKPLDACPTRDLNESLVITSSVKNKGWVEQNEHEPAFVSGWMHSASPFKREKGFALSDHVDWPDLLKTIEETRAKQVLTVHGASKHLLEHLRSKGLKAAPFGEQEQKRGLLAYLK